MTTRPGHQLLTVLLATTIGLTVSAESALSKGSKASHRSRPHSQHRSLSKQLIAAKDLDSALSKDSDESFTKKSFLKNGISVNAELEDEKKSESKRTDVRKSEGKKADVNDSKIISVVAVESSKADPPFDINPFELDTALLSVMRDVSKSLRESEDVTKLENPAQRAAIKAALEAVELSLSRSAVASNRIVPTAAKGSLEKNLIAQSWESGNIKLPNGSQISLNVLWAKKVNGLLNVSIAGNCNCRPNADGDRTGEFVVIINGKSALDSGFDIQSQSNVNFWLGKLNSFSVDATTCGDTQVSSSKEPPKLKALLTNSRRIYLEQHPQLMTLDTASVSTGVAELKKPYSAGDRQRNERPSAAPQTESAAQLVETGPEKQGLQAPLLQLRPESPVPKYDPQSEATDLPAAQQKAEAAPEQNVESVGLAAQLPPASAASKTVDAQVEAARLPSPTAHILAPKRAIAGEYVTVSVLNSTSGKPESFVELNFNQYKNSTNVDGKLVFQIPEDTLPGPSLAISFTSRPGFAPATIEVLQPLMRQALTAVPKIDHWQVNRSNETLTIEGHNFDGIADQNRVLIDGTQQARVLFASPVELKIQLPRSGRSLLVQRNGLRSDPIALDLPRREAGAIVTRSRKKS